MEWDQGFTANPFTSGAGGSKFPALNPLNFKRIQVWGCVLQPESGFSSLHGLAGFSRDEVQLFRVTQAEGNSRKRTRIFFRAWQWPSSDNWDVCERRSCRAT